MGSQKFRFGRFRNGQFNDVVVIGDTQLTSGADIDLSLTVETTAITLRRDGQFVTTFEFGTLLTDGKVGLGTRNAVAAFDDVTLV